MIYYIVDFDIILGMSWLFPHYDVLSCNTKSIESRNLGKGKKRSGKGCIILRNLRLYPPYGLAN